MLGVTVGFMVYLGGPMVLLDRFLLVRFAASRQTGNPELLFDAAKQSPGLTRREGAPRLALLCRRRVLTAVRRPRCSACARGSSAPASTSKS